MSGAEAGCRLAGLCAAALRSRRLVPRAPAFASVVPAPVERVAKICPELGALTMARVLYGREWETVLIGTCLLAHLLAFTTPAHARVQPHAWSLVPLQRPRIHESDVLLRTSCAAIVPLLRSCRARASAALACRPRICPCNSATTVPISAARAAPLTPSAALAFRSACSWPARNCAGASASAAAAAVARAAAQSAAVAAMRPHCSRSSASFSQDTCFRRPRLARSSATCTSPLTGLPCNYVSWSSEMTEVKCRTLAHITPCTMH